MLTRGEIEVSSGDAGISIRKGEHAVLILSEREARWLAIVALPAMLPGMKTPKEVVDERLNRG